MLSPIIHSGVKNLKTMGFQEPKIWKKGQKRLFFIKKCILGCHNDWVLMLGPNICQVIKDLRKTCLQEPKNWKKIENNR